MRQIELKTERNFTVMDELGLPILLAGAILAAYSQVVKVLEILMRKRDQILAVTGRAVA